MKATVAAVLFALLSLVCALAQSSDQGTYRIKPDDVLRIQVYGESQVNMEIPVGADGNISAPFVGTLRAEGKTTAELEAELTDLYKQRLRLRDPKVSITFARYAPIMATVGGAVGKPGQYQMRQGDTILTLLTQAGDPVEGLADMHRAQLRHKGSNEVIPIDLYAMLRRGDLSQNYEVQDGDYLEVPADPRNNIHVLGFVQQPGQYPYREPMTLADAISLAHGEIATKSMMSQVRILREMPGAPGTYVQIRANFVRYMVEGDATQNVTLLPGDLVYVPATKTPDLNQIASLVNSAFFLENVLRNGLFGFRFFR